MSKFFMGTGIAGVALAISGIILNINQRKKSKNKLKNRVILDKIKIGEAIINREIDEELRQMIINSNTKDEYIELEKEKKQCICNYAAEVEKENKNIEKIRNIISQIKDVDEQMKIIESEAVLQSLREGLMYKGKSNHMCETDLEFDKILESQYREDYLLAMREKSILAEQRAKGKDTYDEIIRINRVLVGIQDEVLGEQY